MKKRSSILIVSRNDGTDVRIRKIIETLATQCKCEITFLGCDVKSSSGLESMPGVRVISTPRKTSGTLRKLLLILQLNVIGLRELLRMRPSVVLCVNEEFAPGGIIAKLFTDTISVLELFDSHYMKRKQPRFGFSERIWNALYAYCYRFFDAVVVTDRFRKEFMNRVLPIEKTYVIPNYPRAHNLKKIDNGTKPYKIFVGGTLSSERGLPTILNVVSGMTEDWTIISCGWVYDDVAEAFVSDSRVDYRGVLNPTDALKLVAECDLSYVVYRPYRINNIYASPNRLFDAMSVGIPVLVNTEAIHVSSFVDTHRLGYSARYDDVNDVRRQLTNYVYSRDAWQERAPHITSFQKESYTWDRMCIPEYESILSTLIVSDAVRTAPLVGIAG